MGQARERLVDVTVEVVYGLVAIVIIWFCLAGVYMLMSTPIEESPLYNPIETEIWMITRIIPPVSLVIWVLIRVLLATRRGIPWGWKYPVRDSAAIRDELDHWGF